ncbi:potassium transporter peripheral membrane component [bacterium BMS3Abin05]|nr:potassium transporter peripheral membrane component [bacterium BMS3Abin05]GBE28551.1 potassium transporter peripheral membrane component [bacterium BMS3Bbin03]HDL78130.1 hypothetical protein [Bacteroidota bacterium]
MDILKKVQDSLDKFSKTSTEVAKEGFDILSEKAGELSKFGKTKIDILKLQRKLDSLYTDLGRKAYPLISEKKWDELETSLAEILSEIKAKKDELTQKELEIEISRQESEKTTIDSGRLKELKKDLESGGGTIEQVIIYDYSPVVGKKLKDVELPKEVLIGTILREENVLIPDGNYEFQAGDKVTLLGKKADVDNALPVIAGTPPVVEAEPEEEEEKKPD